MMNNSCFYFFLLIIPGSSLFITRHHLAKLSRNVLTKWEDGENKRSSKDENIKCFYLIGNSTILFLLFF